MHTNPRVTFKNLQGTPALSSLSRANLPNNVNVHESTIVQKLKNGVQERTARRKPLLSKKNMAAHLKFSQNHRDISEPY